MNEINNPPLFIVDGTSDYMRAWTDITLRDLFAMAALSGMLSAEKLGTPADFGDDAYKYADAMLAQRVKP